MSLLYECIHGIVEGGILESIEGTSDGDELAKLCVGKLRSMLVIEGDPNLKYVALLAFQKIVMLHPYLVSLHQDVILQCMDDADISIRMRALDLVVGMVNGDNLQLIVDRLLAQLLLAPYTNASDDANNDRGFHNGVEPRADSDDEDAGESLQKGEEKADQPVALPEDYRINAIRSILSICSRDTYTNVQDFEWYIDVLVKLVRACPAVSTSTNKDITEQYDISCGIGEELRNVAVRVKSLRLDAALAAQSLLMIDTRPLYFPPSGNGGLGVLGPSAWVAGEYAEFLNNAEGVLGSLIHESSTGLPSGILAMFVHAALKVFAAICSRTESGWSDQSRTSLSLLMARVIHFLEPLASHPAIEVQERAVEYLELLRLASEVGSSDTEPITDPPLLLTQAIPNLFVGMELNPVAPGALKKVPIPDNLDLETPINGKLQQILHDANEELTVDTADQDFEIFYNHRVETFVAPKAAAERLDAAAPYEVDSYQQTPAASQLDAAEQALKRKERRERNNDDPFYIGDIGNESSASSSLRNIIKSSNGEDLDIDSIPIMDLSLDAPSSGARTPINYDLEHQKARKKPRKRVEIAGDETIDSSASPILSSSPSGSRSLTSRAKKSVLSLDSSGLGSLSLEESNSQRRSKLDIEQREEEERALREVERLRLEMQRASERIHAKEEAVVVKKKKKKKPALPAEDAVQAVGNQEEVVSAKKKKKKKIADDGEGGDDGVVAKKKKKTRRIVNIDDAEVEET
jgi:AP-3 complex subunit delta-1